MPDTLDTPSAVPPSSNPPVLLAAVRGGLEAAARHMAAYATLQNLLVDDHPHAPAFRWSAFLGPDVYDVVTQVAALSPETRRALVTDMANQHFDRLLEAVRAVASAAACLETALTFARDAAESPTEAT